MEIIFRQKYSLERALYNLKDTSLIECVFEGEEDGESVLKEARNIKLDKCKFCLRYPLWHVDKFHINNCSFLEPSRASIWYSKKGEINNSEISSVKAIRECANISINNCKIDSVEFCWKSNIINLNDSSINSEYAFFDSNDIKLNNIQFKGKYSFQYVNNLEINDSVLDTKDAFWHSTDVIVVNTTLKGEYLGWFSKNLTLINCKIIGTQPFCYCTNLKLVDCEMIDTDLAFEYSSVNAKIKGNVKSIKNPLSGEIYVDSVEEIIHENDINNSSCKIIVNGKEIINY